VTSLPQSYEQSRLRFRDDLIAIRKFLPAAQIENHPLTGEEDLSIDWIFADAIKDRQKLLILTTGEHGIEGYFGSAMLQLFIEDFLPRLNLDTTGILLVHSLNPWGMKHHRHTNSSNVDLNRSFVTDFSTLPGSNPDFDLLLPILEPTSPLKFVPWDVLVFTFQTIFNLARYGMIRLREASMRGQFNHPQGIYYGGANLQEETGLMMALFERFIPSYHQMVMLDLHTGYGPRGRMTLVTSAQEKMTSEKMVSKFGIPLVAAANPQEFYSIQGDMIEYLYAWMHTNYPDKKFFAATCDFGTFGDSLGAVIRSLYTIVFENRVYWHGGSEASRRWMQAEYVNLYAPPRDDWFEEARTDCQRGFEGILKGEGYF
jgi:hypothetical protein